MRSIRPRALRARLPPKMFCVNVLSTQDGVPARCSGQERSTLYSTMAQFTFRGVALDRYSSESTPIDFEIS